MAERWLVVGLGNPGPGYAATRHNVGAMVLGVLGARAGVTLTRHAKAHAEVAETRVIGGPSVVLAFPLSYMNRSGGPVAALQDYYDVPPERTIVLHDELDLPFETVRIKFGGGHGGHNGLRDISAARGTDYLRVRIGVGRPPGRQDPADYVLKPFAKSERDHLGVTLELAADAVESIIAEGHLAAQQRFHAPA